MSVIKKYRFRDRVRAFQYNGPDSLPSGWRVRSALEMGAIVEDTCGSAYVVGNGMWLVLKGKSVDTCRDEVFINTYEECES